jgi:hypothetical protein
LDVWSFEKEIVFSEMVIILVGALGWLYIILKSDTHSQWQPFRMFKGKAGIRTIYTAVCICHLFSHLNQLLITNKFTGMVNGSPKNTIYSLYQMKWHNGFWENYCRIFQAIGHHYAPRWTENEDHFYKCCCDFQ